jgi:hypothetical protein
MQWENKGMHYLLKHFEDINLQAFGVSGLKKYMGKHIKYHSIDY